VWSRCRFLVNRQPDYPDVQHCSILREFNRATLGERIPGPRNKIEMRDAATPVTWNRYTGNWRGSYEGWLPSGANLNMQMKRTLPKLDNFYMIGHWTTPGGRTVIQLVCKKDKKRFVTTEP